MMLSKPASERAQRIVITLVLIVGGIPVALPMVWLVLSSLKTAENVLTDKPEWLPVVDEYTIGSADVAQRAVLVSDGWGEVLGVWRVKPAGPGQETGWFLWPSDQIETETLTGYVARLGLLKRAVTVPESIDDDRVQVGQLGTQRRVAVEPGQLHEHTREAWVTHMLGQTVQVNWIDVDTAGMSDAATVQLAVAAPSAPFWIAAERVFVEGGGSRVDIPSLGGTSLPVLVDEERPSAGVCRVRLVPGPPVEVAAEHVHVQRRLVVRYEIEENGRLLEVKPTRRDADGRPTEVAVIGQPRRWTISAADVTKVTRTVMRIRWLGQSLTVRPAVDVAAPAGWVALIPEAPHDSVAVAADRVAHARRMDPRWSNYLRVFGVEPLHKYVLNTVFITALSIIGNVLSCGLVGYAFARLQFRGRDALFVVVLSTMMLPTTITFLPTYILYVKIGWLDTFYPLVVPTFLATTAFFVFLYRQFFLTIPLDLEDAARIDGCGPLGAFWHIMLPMARPAVVTVTVFTFMAAWNDFMGPLLYINTDEYQTLAYGLYSFKSSVGYKYPNYMMAASTMMMLPVLIIFFLAQKAFMRGVVVSGVKG